ncbi:MAG: hypothetical protein IPQ01_14980, partial [Zoogloea sp.]|nr:hypothetical protein [Zoogloea sp.]
PRLGRYLSADPIGIEGGPNGYGYVGGDPVGKTDPSGLVPIAGNWCGPNWTGGREETFNSAASPGYYDQRRATDNACQRHDMCYQECRQQRSCSSDDATVACFRKCDRQLASEIPFSFRDRTPIGQQSMIYFWMRINCFSSATD